MTHDEAPHPSVRLSEGNQSSEPHGCLDAVWALGAGKLLCCKEEEAGIGVRVQEAAQMFCRDP